MVLYEQIPLGWGSIPHGGPKDMREELYLAIIILAIYLGIAYQLYSLDNYSLLYYGDSISHLIIARKIYDWQDPGLEQLGTVWLPLSHLLFALPATLDILFFTGFVALVINVPATILSSIVLYRLLLNHTDNRKAFFLTLLYPFNPNTIYLSITAMTESLLILFFVLSAFYLLRVNSNSKYMIFCALSIALATLVRYEGWFLPLFTLFYSIRYYFLYKRYDVLLYSLISFIGIVIWLSWNIYYYNDPFEFMNSEFYSASWQAANRDISKSLLFNPINVIYVYTLNLIAMHGPLVLSLLRFEKNSIYLAILPIFTIISLLIGIGELSIWFNSRFLILIAPLLIILTARIMHIKLLKVYTISIYAYYIIITLGMLSIIDYNLIPVTYQDAKTGFDFNKTPLAIGEFMRKNYDYGNIMIITGSMQEHKIMISSWIPLNKYDEIIESSRWKESFYKPWNYDRWFIISTTPDSDGINVSRYWLENLPELYKHYDIVYEYENYKIFKRKY